MSIRDSLAITAMWFAGFNTFQPVNICRGGPEFLLKRFGFPLSAVGMFVGETASSVNFFVVVGTLAGLFLSAASQWFDSAWSRYITPVLSLFSSTVIVLINCRILAVYRTCEGCEGIRKMYYWLSMAGLAYGFDMPVTWNVTPEKSTDWSLGENIANGFLLFLHWFLRLLLKSCIGVNDMDYYIMLGHIATVLLISIVTLALWVIHVFFNVFYGNADKSDFDDALQWLLKLKKSAENGSGSSGGTGGSCSTTNQTSDNKWQTYLECTGQSTGVNNCQQNDCSQKDNFVKYFDKVCGLNKALKALDCTADVTQSLHGSPKLSDSKYQLRGNMEKVQEPLEKLKGITDKMNTSGVNVCVTVQNGSNGGNKCCCTGNLSVTKQFTITISGIKGTFKDCVSTATTSETIKLCACAATVVTFKCGDATVKTVAVKVVSGELSLKTSDSTFTLTGLTCTIPDEAIEVSKLRAIAFVGLKGSKEGCNVTNLRIGISLDIDPAERVQAEVCTSETTASSVTRTVTLQSTSCITVGGTVRTTGAALCLRVGKHQACAGFTYSSCGKAAKDMFNFGLLFAYDFSSKPIETDVTVVSWILNLSKDSKSTCTLTLKVDPAVVITDCTPASSITGTTAKVQKICPIDHDQKNNYRNLKDLLKEQFPKKTSEVDKKLTDNGVTQEISGACYCSTTKSITISSDKDKVCLYLVDGLKNATSAVTDNNKSKVEAVKAFVETKTNEVKKGFLHAALNGMSPFLMVNLAVAFIFMMYPGISPYLMLAEEWQYISSLILLFISSLGPFIPWTLCLEKVRPLAKYDTLWVGESVFYHYFWALVAPMLLIYATCLVSLHYPQSWSSRNIRHHCPAIIICYFYHTCVFVLRAIGSGGMYPNGAGTKPEKKLSEKENTSGELYLYESDPGSGTIIATAGISVSMSVMVAAGFATQAYVSSYRTYVESHRSGARWPTEGKNWFSGYLWWFAHSVPKAYTRFKNIRDMDIVTALG